ncbi:MAG: response regulator, partial [Nitrospinota bacterium]
TWSEHMFRIMGFEMSSVVPSEEEQKGGYAGNDWSEVLDCREQVYKKGISKTFEAVLKDKGSGEKRILIHARAERDQLDNITGVFGTCQDITLIKQTEDRLKKAKEEAEKTTRLKDKFVSLVAHDLQGPSTANVNLVQLILQDNETPARPEHQEILTNILQSSHKMNLLVKDVLNIGRLKTGNIQLKKRYVNAWKLVEQVLTHLMIKTNSKGVHFFNNIPEDAMIFVDKVLLSQVLENILTNALKFCTRGDTVDIFQPAGETSSLAVRDTGSGMAEKTLKNLFSYELGSSIKGTAGEVGTGLGLPLANDIVSAHGGEIRVETKLGEGSLFVLQLPLLKPLVLIVDDEKIFIEEQKIHLRELDIDVIEAGNGREALNILEKRKPQLIITDVKMPYMGGMEFLEEVRANPETTRIPVIVVTGFEGMGIRDQAFKTGADDFVAKPFDSDELIPRVKRFVSA